MPRAQALAKIKRCLFEIEKEVNDATSLFYHRRNIDKVYTILVLFPV
jgi:hypothetical protein